MAYDSLTHASPALYEEAEKLRSLIRSVDSMRRTAKGARLEALQARRASLQAALDLMPARVRLADIEARWERTVDVAANALYGAPGDYKTETASRNLLARRRARRGLKRLETVAEEMRRAAGDAILARLHLPALDGMRRELDEAWELRRQIEAASTLAIA